jgi:hypothetical protein
VSHLPTLRVLADRYAVCRLTDGAMLDLAGFAEGDLAVVARSPGELTLVCREDLRPPQAIAEIGFRALGVLGPLDFSLVGILAGLTAVLAEAEVSVFAVSTYDTDFLLLPASALEVAVSALRAAGYRVLG